MAQKYIISPNDLIEGDIFELLGLQNMDEQKKEETMSKLIEGLNSRVLIQIDDQIKEEDRKNWHTIIETEDDEVIRNFLINLGIKLDEIIAQEALLMKKELVEAIHNME